MLLWMCDVKHLHLIWCPFIRSDSQLLAFMVWHILYGLIATLSLNFQGGLQLTECHRLPVKVGNHFAWPNRIVISVQVTVHLDLSLIYS